MKKYINCQWFWRICKWDWTLTVMYFVPYILLPSDLLLFLCSLPSLIHSFFPLTAPLCLASLILPFNSLLQWCLTSFQILPVPNFVYFPPFLFCLLDAFTGEQSSFMINSFIFYSLLWLMFFLLYFPDVLCESGLTNSFSSFFLNHYASLLSYI